MTKKRTPRTASMPTSRKTTRRAPSDGAQPRATPSKRKKR